jgi:hypothetical protein
LPTWRIRVERAPRVRKAYAGDVQSNAAAWAPTPLLLPLQAFGGDEQTFGAPVRLVPTGDPKMAAYLPAEMLPSRWAAPVVANLRYTTLTTPSQSPLRRRIRRDIHIPAPAGMRATGTSALIGSSVEGGRAHRVPRGIATATPAAKPSFPLFGGGRT